MSLPSLLDLCIQAAASSRHWTVQRRNLERLPDQAANKLLELLLDRQSRLQGGGRGGAGPLRPATMELFRCSATRVVLRGDAVTAEWLAALAGFRYLDTLHLTGCSKINAAALQALILSGSSLPSSTSPSTSPSASPNQPLKLGSGRGTSDASVHAPREASPPSRRVPVVASCAGTCLRHLDLSGSSHVRDDALPLLAHLTHLQSLNISETGVLGTGLSTLTALVGLTRLQAGGLKSVGDEAWVGLLSGLTALRHLEMWGSNAGGGANGGEQLLLLLAAGLPHLRHLNVAWASLTTLPALPELQVLDMRHCQLREVWWPAGHPSRMALRQLLLNGATLSGAAAVTDPESPMGLASLLRHSAATLEHLDLSQLGSPESWTAPLAALAAAADGIAPRLTHLDLSRTAVEPADLACLQCAPALQRLSASGTKAGSPQGAAALVAGGLAGLQDLDLSSCSLTDITVSWLQQLTGLTALNLSGNPNLSLAPTASLTSGQPPDAQQQRHLALEAMAFPDVWAASNAAGMLAAAAPPPLDPDDGARLAAVAAAAATSGSGMGTVAGGGGYGVGSNSSLTGQQLPGSSADCGWVWPYLRRLNLLGTRVGEAGFRTLFTTANECSSEGGGLEVSEATRAYKGPLRLLEQLKAGGPGLTDGAVGILAAARLPNLHSLLLRDAPLTGHGALLLPSSLPSLRRLELQACWLVSVQDAVQLAATCRAGALVVINGKAVANAGTSAGLTSGNRAVATSPGSLIRTMVGISTCEREQSAAGRGLNSAAAPRAQQNRGAASAWTIAAGIPNNQGNTVSEQDDLSHFDQRLRYDKKTLLRLAASPLIEGAGIRLDGRKCREIVAERANDGSEHLYLALADLPEAIRR
ncbi:hypothetical protein VaNZ11_007690 [Volvox africanus]|uniref:Flagellar associated protein n=1 Tax=Volvox africanus TaxID=51714 RepID=A0ABQ5S4J5_9CHLO|nr:hypothetical protein VaNZ11_007690 [Volvox africanus]